MPTAQRNPGGFRAIPFLAGLVALAVTAVALLAIHHLAKGTREIGRQSSAEVALSGRLRLYAEMESGSARAFLLTGDPGFLRETRSKEALILATLDTLARARPDGIGRDLARRVREDQERYTAALAAGLREGIREAPPEERSAFFLRELAPPKRALEASCEALFAHQRARHLEEVEGAGREARRGMALIALLGALGLLAVAGRAVRLRRRLRRLETESDRRLRAQQDLLATIAANSGQALFLQDADRRITFMNSAAEALTGWRAGEALGRNFHDLVHPFRPDGTPYPTTECTTGRAHAGRRRVRGEDFLRRKDGTYLPITVISSPVLEDGRVAGMVVEAEDISEKQAAERAREEAEKAVREAKDSLTLATEAGGIGIWVTQADGTVILSERLRAMVGLPPTGGDAPASLLALVHPEDREAVQRAAERAISPEGEGEFSAEYRVIRPDGEVRWLLSRGRAWFTGTGGERVLDCFRGASVDITPHKRAEEELIRFRTLVEESNDFIAMADPEGRCLFLNAGGRRMAGMEEGAGFGLIVDYLFREDVERVWRVWHKAASEGQWLGEFRLRHRTTGRAVPVMWNIFPLHGPGGGVYAMAAVGRDMTRLHEQEELLRQGQKMEAIGKLAGGIAHDFNNILTVINGYGELLRGGLAPDDPNRHLLDAMLESGRRAASLTAQLLAYGRKQVLQPRVLDLNEVVERTAVMLRRLIGEDIELRLRLDRSLPKIKADPVQIDQILINLCLNARDAMEKGGSLLIETGWTRLAEGMRGRFGDLAPGTYVTLTVVDNGSGMPEDVLERIFEPFFTTKETGKGSGLGLSSAYGVIRQSGGGIEVRSRPGEGSTFRVYLPSAARPEDARPGPEGPADWTGPVAGRVLLVEDEAHVRTITRNLLELGGTQVWEARDGVEALALYDRMRPAPDLVLTDVLMPRMGGRQLAEEVRKRRPDQRILFMSGYSEEALPESAASRPGFHFLRKPFTSQGLLHAVQEALHAQPVEG